MPVPGQAIDTQYAPGQPAGHSSIDITGGGPVTIVLKAFCVIPGTDPTPTIAGSIDVCGQTVVSDGSWKCVGYFPSGNWAETGYDDSSWPAAQVR